MDKQRTGRRMDPTEGFNTAHRGLTTASCSDTDLHVSFSQFLRQSSEHVQCTWSTSAHTEHQFACVPRYVQHTLDKILIIPQNIKTDEVQYWYCNAVFFAFLNIAVLQWRAAHCVRVYFLAGIGTKLCINSSCGICCTRWRMSRFVLWQKVWTWWHKDVKTKKSVEQKIHRPKKTGGLKLIAALQQQ